MLSPATQGKIEQLATSLGLYVYDIEFLKENNHPILRISITRKAPMQILDSKQNMLSLQDCQHLSELLSPLLDVEDINIESYALEVSSPGLERVLKKPRHYTFSLGEQVSIKLMDKSVIEGILQDFSERDGRVEIRQDNQNISLNIADIKKIKVIFEL